MFLNFLPTPLNYKSKKNNLLFLMMDTYLEITLHKMLVYNPKLEEQIPSILNDIDQLFIFIFFILLNNHESIQIFLSMFN
jgi:hypothetical protein